MVTLDLRGHFGVTSLIPKKVCIKEKVMETFHLCIPSCSALSCFEFTQVLKRHLCSFCQ